MIKPLNENILIKATRIEKTDTGLIIPDTNKAENIEEGEVLEVGEGRKTIAGVLPIKVKKGDKIIYTHYSPRKFKHNGEEFMIISEDDILAIIK